MVNHDNETNEETVKEEKGCLTRECPGTTVIEIFLFNTNSIF